MCAGTNYCCRCHGVWRVPERLFYISIQENINPYEPVPTLTDAYRGGARPFVAPKSWAIQASRHKLKLRHASVVFALLTNRRVFISRMNAEYVMLYEKLTVAYFKDTSQNLLGRLNKAYMMQWSLRIRCNLPEIRTEHPSPSQIFLPRYSYASLPAPPVREEAGHKKLERSFAHLWGYVKLISRRKTEQIVAQFIITFTD